MPIDQERLTAEINADLDVIRSLTENGDVPSIVRPVDVRFAGDDVAIDRLKALVGGTTWRIVQVVPTDKGELAIDLERDQTTDSATVIELTKEALQLEEKSGARYDGWGTIAKAKTEL